MDDEQAAQDPAGAAPALPPPERLSVYTFRTHYHALQFPLWLLLGAVALVLLHLLMMAIYHGYAEDDPGRIRWHLVSVFDLGEEESIGTWFSAVTLLFIGRIAWGHGKALLGRRVVWGAWWILLAIAFHAMSLDEVVDLHETLREWYEDHGYGSDAAPATQRVLLFTAAFVGAAMVPFLFRVSRRFALITVISGALYLLALWIDAMRGSNLREQFDSDRAWYAATYPWVALEEGLEMIAPLLFLHGMLAELAGSPQGAIEEQVEVRP